MSCNTPWGAKPVPIVIPFNTTLEIHIELGIGRQLFEGELYVAGSVAKVGWTLRAPTFRQVLGLMADKAAEEQRLWDSCGVMM